MASVQLRHLQKSIGSQHILADISLDIADGAFVVLVGPSGCGKSTLLRMIAGLEDIDDGEICVDGEVINATPPKDRDIAMVFQSYALYPHMSVRQNMGFSMRLAGAPAERRDAEVMRAANILDLEALLDRSPRDLSGGQRQRVAMGRAIVRNPAVFLFDEPLSNLDARLRVKMRTEIKALHQRLRTTMIYVTHDQIEAMTMADMIVVMREGRIEQIGTPLELYDQPCNAFVAGFIGSPAMNFLHGRIGTHRDAPCLVMDDGLTVPMDSTALPAASQGRIITLGVRPEHFSICPDGGLPARIATVEPTGAETQLVCRIGEQRVVVTVPERINSSPGDSIRLAIAPAKSHAFDQQSLQRL
jgi:multiple sugar transport system ATP-binding protein